MNSTESGDLNALRIFIAVTEAAGITAAAEKLGMTKAKVSVEIRRLETALGVSLFTRTTRRVVPSEEGRRLYESCQPLLLGLTNAMAEVSNSRSTITGSLKITASVDHSEQVLAAVVTEFVRQYPQVNINLCASDHIVDMLAEGVDVAFRMGWLQDSSLRAVKLGEFEQYVVASPTYLREHGTPYHPQELTQHTWIVLSLLPTPLTWRFISVGGEAETVRLSSRLQTDSPAALRSLVSSGAGLSVLNKLSVANAIADGRLQRLLPEWSLPRGGVYAVYPPGRHLRASVRAFIEFYRTKLNLASSTSATY